MRDGQAALSMRRIADECGMKLGNLQYYFPSCDDLLDAFGGDWICVEQEERQLLLSENLSSLKSVLKWIDDSFSHLTKRRFENSVANIAGAWWAWPNPN